MVLLGVHCKLVSIVNFVHLLCSMCWTGQELVLLRCNTDLCYGLWYSKTWPSFQQGVRKHTIKTYNNTISPHGAWWWPVFVQFIRYTVSTSFFICQGQLTNVQMNDIIEKLGGKWIVAHMDLHHVSCTQSFTLTYAGNNLFHALLLFSLPGTSRKASPWKWMYTIKKESIAQTHKTSFTLSLFTPNLSLDSLKSWRSLHGPSLHKTTSELLGPPPTRPMYKLNPVF